MHTDFLYNRIFSFHLHILIQQKICNKMRGHMIGLQKNVFLPLRMPGKRVFGVQTLENVKNRKLFLISSFCIKTNQKN